VDPLQALRIQVHRDQLAEFGLALENMGRLAARGGAGVEHQLAGRRFEQLAAIWAAASCTEQWPSSKPGRLVTSTGRARRRACRPGRRARPPALPAAAGPGSGYGVVAGVDPDPHGRVLVVGFEDLLPPFRVGLLQPLHQPVGVGQAQLGQGIDPGDQLVLPALHVAQHAVDHAPEGLGLEQLAGVDGLGQGGVGRDPGVEQLVDAHQQQGVHRLVFALERLFQQLLGDGIEPAVPAQAAEAELLQQRPVLGGDFLLETGQQGGHRLTLVDHLVEELGRGGTGFHKDTDKLGGIRPASCRVRTSPCGR
jgi:hypothetical protein